MRGRIPPQIVAPGRNPELADDTQELLREVDTALGAVSLKQLRRSRSRDKPVIGSGTAQYRMHVAGVKNQRRVVKSVLSAEDRQQQAQKERERQAVRRKEKQENRHAIQSRKGGIAATVTVSTDCLDDPDWEKVKEEIRDYFGSRRGATIVRASSLQTGEIPDPDQVG